jgi:hypothetical protein
MRFSLDRSVCRIEARRLFAFHLLMALSYISVFFVAFGRFSYVPRNMLLWYAILIISLKILYVVVDFGTGVLFFQQLPVGAEFVCSGALIAWGHGPKVAAAVFIGFGLVVLSHAAYRTLPKRRYSEKP